MIARHSPREASCGKLTLVVACWLSDELALRTRLALGCMTTGWKIVTVLKPSGASPLQEWSLVAIPDKGEAIRAIKARHPHAAIRVNSEADAELLAKYDVRDGKIFVLVEGS